MRVNVFRRLIVLDFDGTCTHRKEAAVPLVVARMSLAGQRRYAEANVKYAIDYHRTEFSRQIGRALLANLCETFVVERMHERAIADAVVGVPLREGLVPFLKDMKDRAIPVVIVSFAIKQVIQSILLRNGALDLVDEVYAASLLFDADGRVAGYDPGSLVHPAVKGEVSRFAARRRGVLVRNILAAGDSLGDMTLGGFRRNRLGLAHEPEDIPVMRRHFGEIIHLKDHAFHPAAAWFRRKLLAP